jgi:large repetitive protein
MKKIKPILITALLVFFSSQPAFAEKIPENHSNVEYFYVFGPQGNPLMGADDSLLELFIDMPAGEGEPLSIEVFDPDTGGKRDWLDPRGSKWDTKTKFSIYGQSLLDEKVVAREGDFQYLSFGPYSKEDGVPLPGAYRFRVVVEAVSGDDANLFKFRISPDSAESFSNNITFRLAADFGDKMYFYPQIPAGTTNITVENFDLDRSGGTSQLFDIASRESGFGGLSFGGKYEINDSQSGQWKETPITLSPGPGRRLEYVITKRTQRYAHAGLRLRDENGALLPIYFKKTTVSQTYTQPKARPQEKMTAPASDKAPCNTFTFDATGSYDPAQSGLSFLWNFGDGRSSNEPVVTHTFDKAGEYTVTLTVVDGSDLECDTAIVAETVKVNLPPIADFRVPQAACVKETITFDASFTRDSDEDKLTYRWDFGDMTGGNGQKINKSYDKGGEYAVKLWVDDNRNTECSVDSITRTVRINTAPRADAGRDTEMCLDSFDEKFNLVFDASGSNDPDGDDLTYVWDFGDGEKGEGKRVNHLYAKAGIYTAVLTVDDGRQTSCSAASDQARLTLNKRPGAIAGESRKVCVGDKLRFSGDSGVKDNKDFSFSWDFGDGQRKQGKTPEHTYKKGGAYKVIFAVDDNRGSNCSTSADIIDVDVNTRPLAKVQNVKPVCRGETVFFDGTASYDPDQDPLTYHWDFGDGSSEEGSAKMSHIYQKGGEYTVGLTVDDGRGRECSVDRDIISCKVNTPPVANPGPNLVCCEGQVTEFDGSDSYDSDGDALEYFWDFGDGNTAKGVKVSHAYPKQGVYNVILTVDDGSQTPCSASSAGFEAKVKAMPVPVIKIR